MDIRREGATVVAVAVGVRTRAAVVAVAVGVRTRTVRAMSHHIDRSGQSQTSGKQWTLEIPQLANDAVGDLRVAETSSWDLRAADTCACGVFSRVLRLFGNALMIRVYLRGSLKFTVSTYQSIYCFKWGGWQIAPPLYCPLSIRAWK